MIFASDLDRTLIYSKRFLKKQDFTNTVVVDQTDLPISYMSKKAVELLEKIRKEIIFVPVTTRSSKEFERLSFSQHLEYAVINNGATILVNGKVDPEWKAHVEALRSQLSTSFESIKKQVLTLFSNERIAEFRIGDGYYWTCILAHEPDVDRLRDWRTHFNEQGWICEGTGKKIYLIPDFMTKASAFFFLKENYLTGKILAAGDSFLDYDLLIHSDKSYVPKHGALANCVENSFIQTQNTGYKAGEEILERVWEDILKE